MFILSKIKRHSRLFLGKYFPKLLVTLLYKKAFGYWIDWSNPRNLNEKIHWLKFNSDTTLWTKLTDKYRVREFIEEKGCSELLVKLYGVWEDPTMIDWEILPNQFVLKSNGGCGDIIICNDKNKIDKDKIVKYFKKILKIKCGYERGEPHYNAIKPVIIAEELLDVNKQSISTTSLIDYKIWCFDGRIFGTWCCYNRNKCHAATEWHDLDWTFRPEWSNFTSSYQNGNGIVPKPKNYQKMLKYASELSKGFKQVRIDLYNIDGEIYFGEMTFTSAGGYMNFYSDDVLKEMGDMVIINKR